MRPEAAAPSIPLEMFAEPNGLIGPLAATREAVEVPRAEDVLFSNLAADDSSLAVVVLATMCGVSRALTLTFSEA